MKRVCLLTATRAEYGLMRSLIKRFYEDPQIDFRIVATGMHLSPDYGLTYKEIEGDGFEIDKKIDILLSSNNNSSISKSMGLAMISFAEYFAESKPDILIVDGDRYETIAVCMAAMNERIPIVHIGGGETTEGAIDEFIRHSITKMSYLHFVGTEQYKRRVVQLGEDPERVFCVGALGVEAIKNIVLLERNELSEQLDFDLSGSYALVTFHPVTLENESVTAQVMELLKACEQFPDIKFIFTMSNADMGGKQINLLLKDYVKKHEGHAAVFESLGSVRYLSAVKHSKFVMGNSSSGIIEVPSLGKPTINIGNRQRGRMQAESVINCNASSEDIIKSINQAISQEFSDFSAKVNNPYEGVNPSQNIYDIVKEYLALGNFRLDKKFYDV